MSDLNPTSSRVGTRRLISVLLAAALVTAAVGGAVIIGSPPTAGAATFTPGAQTRFSLPDHNSAPSSIAAGADGAVWVAESKAGAIVRMAADGSTLRYAIPSHANPTSLAAGADGTIWWVAQGSHAFGYIADESVTEWNAGARGEPVAVASSGDSTWFVFGAGGLVRITSHDPATMRDFGSGFTTPSGIAATNGTVWVSEASTNHVVTFGPDGTPGSTLTVASPTIITPGDGGFYVVSAGSSVLQYTSAGAPTGVNSTRTDAALISGVVATGGGELWYSQSAAQRLTVVSRVGGVPGSVDLPGTGGPSSITLGADGGVWSANAVTGDVTRTAHDYVVPGLVPGGVKPLSGVSVYTGEPLGPISLRNVGSGDVGVVVGGTIPPGMRFDPAHPDVLGGVPDTVGSFVMQIALTNTYYGGVSATVRHTLGISVRSKPLVERIGGVDRYEVAINASKARFRGGSATVYIASGEKFADALSAGPVAVMARAPLLLTPHGNLPPSVKAELVRLKPKRIIIVGGLASVSEAVQSAIQHSIDGVAVARIGGADRYEVSRNLLLTADLTHNPAVYISTGASFADALSAAPTAGSMGSAVLLVNGAAQELPPATLQFLTSHNLTDAYLVGGPNSISEDIEFQLRPILHSVVRLGGADRFEASSTFNRHFLEFAVESPGRATDPLNMWPRSVVYLASGETFADALSGGVAAGLEQAPSAPLYVVRHDCVPRSVLLDIGSMTATRVVILGGPNTLSPAVAALTPCP